MTLDFDNFVDLEKSQTWKAKLDFLKKQNFSSSNVKKLINDAEASINSIDMNVDSTSYTVEQIYTKLKEDVKEYSKYDKSDKSANSWYRFYTAIDQIIPMLLTLSSYKSWMIQFFYVAHNKMLDLLTQLVEEQNEFMKIKFKAEAWEKMYSSAMERKGSISDEKFAQIQEQLKSELESKNQTIQTITQDMQRMESTIEILTNAQKELDQKMKIAKEQAEKPKEKEQKEDRPKPTISPPPFKYPQKEVEEAKIKRAIVDTTYQSEENPEPNDEALADIEEKEPIDELDDESDDEIEPTDKQLGEAMEDARTPSIQEPDPKEVEAFIKQQGFQDETTFFANEKGGKNSLSYPLESAAEIEELLGLNRAEYNNRKKKISILVTLLIDSEYENYSYSWDALSGFLGMRQSTVEKYIQAANISTKRISR